MYRETTTFNYGVRSLLGSDTSRKATQEAHRGYLTPTVSVVLACLEAKGEPDIGHKDAS